jgi:hypothetical protein
MNRLKKAWLALTDRLEPGVREVVREVERIKEVPMAVGDKAVTVFVARSRSHKGAMEKWYEEYRQWWKRQYELEYSTLSSYGRIPIPQRGPEPERPTPPDWHGRAYLTCTQAFKAHGADADLTPSMALIDKGRAYLFDSLCEVDLAPKPKRPKGSRA